MITDTAPRGDLRTFSRNAHRVAVPTCHDVCPKSRYVHRVKRPLSLSIVVLLQWIAALVGIFVGILIMLSAFAVNTADVRSAIDAALAQEGVTGVSSRVLVLGIVASGLIAVGVSVVRAVIARSLGRGRNWARLLLTVLGVLNLLSGVLALFGDRWQTGATTVVIEVAILWLMWNSASSAFFRAAKAST